MLKARSFFCLGQEVDQLPLKYWNQWHPLPEARVPGFPGCLELSALLYLQIKREKREKGDLQVEWTLLAYGSVPHQLIKFTLGFFYIPTHTKTLVLQYFQDFKMCCTHQDFITDWQHLVVIFKPSGQRLQLLKGIWMTSHTFSRQQHLHRDSWRGWQAVWVPIRDQTTFVAGGEQIPQLTSQPVRSLDRTYIAEPSVRQMGETVRKQLRNGLARINQCQLPGKYNIWSYQVVLYPKVIWPLKLSENG